MPNWCANHLTLRNKPEMIRRAKLYAEKNNLLQLLNPKPFNLTDEESYVWRVQNWGTKWEPSILHIESSPKDGYISLEFESAWAPPIQALKHAEETLGFQAELYFFECGAGLLGMYRDGEETYFDLPVNTQHVDDVLKTLPPEMVEKLDLHNELYYIFEVS